MDDYDEAAEAAAAGVVRPWQPWYNSERPRQVAGYAVEYDSGMIYATVKGAGECLCVCVCVCVFWGGGMVGV